MPIAYYSGPEGACKSVMMGRDCLYHHNCGGHVYAFPGFEVMDNKGTVISELLLPEEWVKLLNEAESSYVVAIDEIPNFLNHHKWNSDFVDLITYGAAAQRRKRSLVILATGPIFDWLPRDLKTMFHEVINMEDRHWKVKTIPRGEQAVFTREDRRGVLSGQIGRRTRPKVFYAKRYWRNIETYSIVDPRWQLNKIKFDKRKVNLDADGNVINPEFIGESDPATLDRLFQEYQSRIHSISNPMVDGLKYIIDKANGNPIDSEPLYEAMNVSGSKKGKDKVGTIMRRMNYEYQGWSKRYVPITTS